MSIRGNGNILLDVTLTRGGLLDADKADNHA